jgi:hypothetical protein
MRKGEVEELMKSTLLEAKTSTIQGIQLKTFSETSKKTLAMVLMDLGKVHEVLPNIYAFASKTFPQLGIKTKKDEPDQGKKRLEHLDIVVTWALKEFKVGIINPPPLKNGIQQLYLENIKKLSFKGMFLTDEMIFYSFIEFSLYLFFLINIFLKSTR